MKQPTPPSTMTAQDVQALAVNLHEICHPQNSNTSGDYPCIICGKPVKSYAFSARGIDGDIETIIPHAVQLPDSMLAGDMGFYPIGSECVKTVKKFLCSKGKKPDDYIYTKLKNFIN